MMNFEELPQELLLQICGYLADTHRRSLYSLALVNHRCQYVADHRVFDTVNLTLSSRTELLNDTSQWSAILTRRKSWQQVRRLTVAGCLTRRIVPEDPSKLAGNRARRHKSVAAELYGEETRTLDRIGPVYDLEHRRPEQEEELWQGTADLLANIQRLTQFDFSCHLYAPEYSTMRFPPILLDALHRFHPECSLNLLDFNFSSLPEEQTNRHELAIVQSPCLSAICIRYTDRDVEGKSDFNLEALCRSVELYAPSLKKVTLKHIYPAHSYALHVSRDRARGTWLGFRPEPPSLKPAKSTVLDELSISNYSTPAHVTLATWCQITDLSRLVTLRLANVTSECLAWIDTNLCFSRLKKLHIDFFEVSHVREEIALFNHRNTHFFTILPALEDLTIGPNPRHTFNPASSSIFDCIAERHGQSLRRLAIDDIDQGAYLLKGLFPQFPNLESLQLKLERYNSSEREAQQYLTLGEIPSLREVLIKVRSWSHAPGLSEFHTFPDYMLEEGTEDWEEKRTCGKYMIASCAMDADLARDIWMLINVRRTSNRPLHWLKIHSIGVIQCTGTLEYVVSAHLNRNWMVEPSPRDDSDEIFVRELGKRDREEQLAKQPKLNDKVLGMIYEVWPKQEGKTWEECWKSTRFRIPDI